MAKQRDPDGQQELAGLIPPRPEPLKPCFKPKPSRRDPAIWVRKVSVWSSWPPSPDTELRVISLHRGLNILWAESKDDPKEPRIGGHGAGKTTFCRLLRFILDERQPGPAEFRQDFRRLHDDGWVIGEVIVNSEPWLVGKTLGERGRHHFAIRGSNLTHPFDAQPPAGGYDDYQDALEEAALGSLQIRALSGSGKTLRWVHLLSWLARDQEAHYSNLLSWRDAASEPEGQELSALDRENLIRLVMGLVDKQEQDKLRERAQVAADHTSRLNDRAPLDFIRRRERHALGLALGKHLDDILGGKDADVPDDPLLLMEVQRQATALELEAANAIRDANLEDEEKAAEVRVEEKAGSMRFQRALCNRIRSNLRRLEGKPQDTSISMTPNSMEMTAQLTALEKAIGELRGLCNRTKDEAIAKSCPHYVEPAPDTNTERAIFKQEDRDDVAEAEKHREIQRLTVLLAKQSDVLATMETAEQEARSYQTKVKTFVASERKRLGAPAERAQGIRDALKAYGKACAESTALAEALKGFDERKGELDKEITALAEAHREVITDFGILFDELAKGLLGDKVTGSVHLGKGIEPELTYHGRRKSAALNLSKLLAFDLACMALGMTSEHAHHPRLVVHDSPRESDLSIGIYYALFRTARMLEGACDGEPGFQYIVTTTEAPPEEFKNDRWLLNPVLDASTQTGRFLRLDL